MRLGTTSIVKIDDVEITLYMARGPRRRWSETVAEFKLEDADFTMKHDAAAIQLLAEVVISVKNLQDENGDPVVWPKGDVEAIKALLDEMPNDFCTELSKLALQGPPKVEDLGND